MKVIPNSHLIKESGQSFKLCSAHFDEIYIGVTGRLFCNAVPSKFQNANGVWYTFKLYCSPMNMLLIFFLCRYTIESANAADTTSPQHAELMLVESATPLATQQQPSTSQKRFSSTSTELTTTPKSTKKIRYSGDIKENVSYTPKTAMKALQVCKREINANRKEKRKMQLQIGRLKSKVRGMEEFLCDLRNRNRLKKQEHNTQRIIRRIKCKFDENT